MDISIIWDNIMQMFLIAFPISLLLIIVTRVTNYFTSFVAGGKEVRL